MKMLSGFAMIAALAATDASAQGINLTGQFRCVSQCAGAQPAYVTQNGRNLNLLNEAGEPSRAQWLVGARQPGEEGAQQWDRGHEQPREGAADAPLSVGEQPPRKGDLRPG